jgi:hypothetical protein
VLFVVAAGVDFRDARRAFLGEARSGNNTKEGSGWSGEVLIGTAAGITDLATGLFSRPGAIADFGETLGTGPTLRTAQRVGLQATIAGVGISGALCLRKVISD